MIYTICGVAGAVLVAVISVSVAHVGNGDIHPKEDRVVHKAEFDQFQQRVIDRLDDIKQVQHVIQEDIKAIKNGN
jgi:hypothetical protein